MDIHQMDEMGIPVSDQERDEAEAERIQFHMSLGEVGKTLTESIDKMMEEVERKNSTIFWDVFNSNGGSDMDANYDWFKLTNVTSSEINEYATWMSWSAVELDYFLFTLERGASIRANYYNDHTCVAFNPFSEKDLYIPSSWGEFVGRKRKPEPWNPHTFDEDDFNRLWKEVNVYTAMNTLVEERIKDSERKLREEWEDR